MHSSERSRTVVGAAVRERESDLILIAGGRLHSIGFLFRKIPELERKEQLRGKSIS